LGITETYVTLTYTNPDGPQLRTETWVLGICSVPDKKHSYSEPQIITLMEDAQGPCSPAPAPAPAPEAWACTSYSETLLIYYFSTTKAGGTIELIQEENLMRLLI
jgi:hypothetical protein